MKILEFKMKCLKFKLTEQIQPNNIAEEKISNLEDTAVEFV